MLDVDAMKWHAKLYCLCSSIDVLVPEMAIGNQHIKPMPFPEQVIAPPAGGGRGLGRGRVGRGRGRGRVGAGRGGGADGGDAAIEDAEPFAEGAAAESDEPWEAGDSVSPDSGEDIAEGLGDDEGSDSDDTVATELFDGELEAGELVCTTNFQSI